MRENFTIESLKGLAKQLIDEPPVAVPQENEPNEEEKNEYLPAVIPVEEAEEEKIFEEYNEFPRLDKFKTYSLTDIKTPQKTVSPKIGTPLKSHCSKLTINLLDSDLYEASPFSRELKPFKLKKSYAVFEQLESCDRLLFVQDELGGYEVEVHKGSSKDRLKLGCILKFEFKRPGFNSLIVSAHDIDGRTAVIGAGCAIEFDEILVENNYPERAELQKVSIAELNRMNKEAAGNIDWPLKLS
jgi:hypothetical protein